MTFSLAGFGTIKQAGIQLTANFTASVNAELKVGAIEETVTVSGATPVVDVQSAQSQNVLTRELLDALPTPRNFQAVAITTPGVTISRPDVGGSEGYQITNLTVHGSETRDMSVQIDGLAATTVNGNGSNTAVYHNDLAYEEMSYQTSVISAETLAGGVRVSMVPKDGGNSFKGAAFAGYAPGSLQSDNFSDELRARGLKAVPNVLRIFDYNVAVGGPIFRDRLWFFTTGALLGRRPGRRRQLRPRGQPGRQRQPPQECRASPDGAGHAAQQDRAQLRDDAEVDGAPRIRIGRRAVAGDAHAGDPRELPRARQVDDADHQQVVRRGGWNPAAVHRDLSRSPRRQRQHLEG